MRRMASMICASVVALCTLLAVSPARTWGQRGSPTQTGARHRSERVLVFFFVAFFLAYRLR